MVKNPNITEVTGGCECCGIGSSRHTIYKVVTNTTTYEEGTTICKECWLWDCETDSDICGANKNVDGGWPP